MKKWIVLILFGAVGIGNVVSEPPSKPSPLVSWDGFRVESEAGVVYLHAKPARLTPKSSDRLFADPKVFVSADLEHWHQVDQESTFVPLDYLESLTGSRKQLFFRFVSSMDLRESAILKAGRNYTQAYLGEANLSGISLRNTIFYEANLRGSDLSGTDLTRADLEGADLTGANLQGADLRGALAVEADFTGANVEGVELPGADLTGATISQAQLESTQTGQTVGPSGKEIP